MQRNNTNLEPLDKWLAIYLLLPRIQTIFGFISALSMRSPKIKSLGISIFEKLEKIVESNHLANRVRKKAAILNCCCLDFNYIHYFYNALNVSSTDLVEVNVFIGQTR